MILENFANLFWSWYPFSIYETFLEKLYFHKALPVRAEQGIFLGPLPYKQNGWKVWKIGEKLKD